MAVTQKKKFIIFLLLGYAAAFTVEFFSAVSGDSQIFVSPTWPIFFFIWYGILYSLAYRYQRHMNLWKVALVWAVLGPIIELTLFRGSFMMSDLAYGIMFVVPFWLLRKILSRQQSRRPAPKSRHL